MSEKSRQFEIGVVGVKSEFEAEGLTQLEIADFFVRNPWAQVRVIKLGGCEAKTDFRAAIRLGANVVVAPMIESAFAVKKFASMYPESKEVLRWINIETVAGYERLTEILAACTDMGVEGIVIGRGDLTESLGLERIQVESRQVHAIVTKIAESARMCDLHVGVGGMIGANSSRNLELLRAAKLIDHFETRKVLISADAGELDQAIESALRVEHSWIKSSLANLHSMSQDLELRAARLEGNLRNG